MAPPNKRKRSTSSSDIDDTFQVHIPQPGPSNTHYPRPIPRRGNASALSKNLKQFVDLSTGELPRSTRSSNCDKFFEIAPALPRRPPKYLSFPDLREMAQEILEICFPDVLKLDILSIYPIEYSSRIYGLGQCIVDEKKGKKIVINDRLFTAQKDDVAHRHLRATLAHELIHALSYETRTEDPVQANGENHGPLFHAYAKKVFDKLGLRCLPFKDLPVLKQTSAMAQLLKIPFFEYVCNSCRKWFVQRANDKTVPTATRLGQHDPCCSNNIELVKFHLVKVVRYDLNGKIEKYPLPPKNKKKK